MGVYGLLKYAEDCGLYEEVDMQVIANDFKTRNGAEPVIVVEGEHCAKHLYGNLDSLYGGQYKEFRERCENFENHFHRMGITLTFFFNGVPEIAKIPAWREKRLDETNKISTLFVKLREAQSEYGTIRCKEQGSAVVPCAMVNFKQAGCEVRLPTADLHTEMAQFASSNSCCIGILSNDSEFLIYDGVPYLFALHSLRLRRKVRVWRFQQAKLVSQLGILPCDLPLFASLVGNSIARKKDLEVFHQNLRQCYGNKRAIDLVTELLRSPREDLRMKCEALFSDNCGDNLKLVQTSVSRYRYEVAESGTALNFPGWDAVLRQVEAKHVSSEIPRIVYTVMRYRLWRSGAGLEDRSTSRPDCPPTGLVAQSMRKRLYTILLWDSGTGPFHVTEYIMVGLEEVAEETVEVQKRLPEGIHHPGLLELWRGPEDRRWRIFTWVISPTIDLCALWTLSPQHLVVPVAALFYLYHEAQIITKDEVRIFMMVAVAVKRYYSHELSRLNVKIPTERAVYLATLFVHTVLLVLDGAGACGLSFPRSVECHVDSYFDGKLFHYIYSRSPHTFPPSDSPKWDKSCEETVSRLMYIIELHEVIQLVNMANIHT